MKKFKMDVELENAAFGENTSVELTRILEKVVLELKNGEKNKKIKDINGNTVGNFEIVEE